MVKKTKLSIEEELYSSKTKAHDTDDHTHEHANNVVYLTAEHQEELIAKAAYFKAEQRNFTPGHEMDDWLTAEADIYGLAY